MLNAKLTFCHSLYLVMSTTRIAVSGTSASIPSHRIALLRTLPATNCQTFLVWLWGYLSRKSTRFQYLFTASRHLTGSVFPFVRKYSLCTHAFMAIRIWKLTSRNIPIIAVIALCLLAALTGGTWATVIVGTQIQHRCDYEASADVPLLLGFRHASAWRSR